MLKRIKSYSSFFLPSVLVCLVAVLIILNSKAASEGIKTGLLTCGSIIIPSLFPFMVLSSFTVKSGIYEKAGKLFGKGAEIVFYLPKSTAGVILMSLVGGFPVGAKMAGELFSLGALSQKEAKRLALFGTNAGPAFIISAVGEAMYGSKSAGVIIFISVCLSSLTFGIFEGIYARIKKETLSKLRGSVKKESLLDAFVNSASDSAKAIFGISSWVIVFSAVLAFLKLLPLSDGFKGLIFGIFEVTSGCTESVGILPIYAVAALISFSGFCIFCQIYQSLKSMGINSGEFFLSRLVCACLSFVYCRLIILISPETAAVFSNNVKPSLSAFAVSVPTTVCLLITCALLIFEVDRKKKMC